MSLIDLEERVGFGLVFDTDLNRLRFKGSNVGIQPDIRTKYQMWPVVSGDGRVPNEFYQMYRGVCLVEDMEELKKLNLRFDITVIPNCKIGRRSVGELMVGGPPSPQEFNKTLGHSHHLPEVYEVLHGQAIYLQENLVNGISISVHAKEGDKVLIPSYKGHVTINPGDKPLIMANWISTNTVSEYGGYKSCGGAMHFCVEEDDRTRVPRFTGQRDSGKVLSSAGESKKRKWIVNPNYRDYVEREKPIEVFAKDFSLTYLGLFRDKPIYISSKEKDFKNLEFLQKVSSA